MKKIVIFFTSLLVLFYYAYNGTSLAVTFTNSGQSLGHQPINVEIDVGDIDNDGDLDMIFGGHQYDTDNEVWERGHQPLEHKICTYR